MILKYGPFVIKSIHQKKKMVEKASNNQKGYQLRFFNMISYEIWYTWFTNNRSRFTKHVKGA